MKRYHVTTFGCQMNEHDSERMKGMLESLGYAEAPSADEADLILFNTCSIRETADSRFVATSATPSALKRERRRASSIGVGGCWAQSVKDDVFRQFPFVDVAFGPGPGPQARRVPHQRLADRPGLLRVRGLHRPPADQARARASRRWVQISVGCNMKCSYCIVPSTRGREVVAAVRTSSSPRCERLAADGVREVTLLGQNVNAYGRDLRPRPAFVRRAAARRRRDRRASSAIRYTSPHPKDMREDVIARARRAAERLRAHPPAAAVGLDADPQGDAPHLHARALPDRVALIREHVPDIALTTDIIVGFPGETEADFAADAGGRARRSASTAPSRSSSRRAAGPRRRRSPTASCPTRSRSSAWSGWSRSCSAAPASGRSASSGARSTCSSRARRAPTRRVCAAARRTTRPSTSPASPQPGDIVPVEIVSATTQTLMGEMSLLAHVAAR